MKKVYSLFTLFCIGFLIPNAFAQTTTYSYTTGVVQLYTVPAGVTQISMDVVGAKGGAGVYNIGAPGGRVQVTMNVTPAQVYSVYVGNVGSVNGPNGTTFGNNGTGHKGGDGTTGSSWPGGGGGGSTEIWFGGAPIIVSGAGAGGSGYCTSDIPGKGGGLVGGTGTYCGTTYSATNCGSGGNTTTSTGGAAGTCGTAISGTQYNGGNAGSGSNWASGGGAGWYGGGGGCSTGPGGGGSSYPASAGGSITAVNHTQGYNSTGAGSVAITVLCSAPGAITGTLSACVGATTTLSNPTGASGGTWVSGSTAVGTISSSGVVTGLSAGTTVITYQLGSPCGGTSATATVTINPAAGAITGTASVCNGTGSTLSASPSGGTWSSGTTTTAIIGSATGVVSSSNPGTTTITYNLNNGCATSTLVYTVNTQPVAISGGVTLCGGSVPTSTTLTDATGGGVWTSGSPTVATVGTSSGIVTGVASGTPTITYTIPAGGCFVTKAMSVNAVANITGPGSVCVGTTITEADATSAGIWSSNNSSIASINSFGVVSGVSIGSTFVSYTVSSLGCAAAAPISVISAPTAYSVTGGGSYCSGGLGVHIGLNNSTSPVIYTLYNGTTAITTATGTNSALDFGFVTGSGTYTVVGGAGSSCAANMSGSTTVSVNALPTAFSVGGGGAYCAGGSGVNITTSSSTIGVNYQLMIGGSTPVGSPAVGTSFGLSLGPVTTAGNYTIVATNATTSCINNMAGFATVSVNALPAAFAVTGGGNFCLGGPGVHIGLANSATGVSYQLLISGAPFGTPLSGTTGVALDFGFITTAGLYTVLATTTSTGCTNSMSGAVTVAINPLPTVFSVTGGGSYCLGGSGQPVGLGSSTIGVNYQLYIGTSPIGGLVAGTGAAISFGQQTTAGSYSVVATNATTGCSANMFGSVSISINPLPTLFTVTGGGGYCAGGLGVAVGLSGSTINTTYQLFCNGTLVSAMSGTGGAISFGQQSLAGIYTVVANNTLTGCVGNMSGSVTVVINPLPTQFNVSGGGNYCAGGVGLPINLSGSQNGVNYQIYNGVTATGAAMPGTGAALISANQTAAGSYTIIGTNATTTCSNNMTGSTAIVVNPLPTSYAVTGGGGYCFGASGAHIGIANSNVGINYQLKNGAALVGAAMPGTGSSIDFGFIVPAGTYTVVATNPGTTCTNGMSGSAVIVVNGLPVAQPMTGGGNYCAGGTGLAIGLSNSVTGVNYQLYNGFTPVGASMPGSTGSPVSFGLQTAAGTYTVVGTTAATGCSNNMLGSVGITINSLPGMFVVTGGGNYCAGGAGVHVGLTGSAIGDNYQLKNGTTSVGPIMTGTGGALDFGLITGAGSYTVVASNGSGCLNTMTGTVIIGINPLPGTFTVGGGGNYCAGGTGLHVTLSGSAIGYIYQLYVGTTPSGVPMGGTGLALDFGLKTTAGTYTIVATKTSTGCTNTMTGSAIIVANPLPAISNVTGGGSYCLGSTGVNIGLDNSVTGVDYQLYKGATAVGAAVSGSTGLALNFGLKTATGIYTVVATDLATTCKSNMAGSASVGTYPLPIVYNMTGGGNYCSGGMGVNVGLSGSNIGVTYQLMIGSTPVGASMAGTGVALNFGLQTAAGSYTVVATNTTTLCTNNMNGAANVVISALPTQYNVTGGGNYCAGGTGVVIGIDGSDVGTTYQLMHGVTPVGAIVAGTGMAISFGMQTAFGNYTVVATTTGSTCVNTMLGSATININLLPNAYPVMGGGNYCSGGAGVDISLGMSDIGTQYQLMRGTVMVGTPMAGIGSALDFGNQTVAGVYTIVATDLITGCNNTMTGTATVVVNLLPTTYIVGGGGNYCAGGTGLHITLSGSNAGVSYQLMKGIIAVGAPKPGTGFALDFGAQTAGGTYTVEATNNTTSCMNTMTGSVAIVVDPLPTVFSVSSTSSTYCAGGAGVNVWLNTSETGVNYQLYNGSTVVGTPLPGTGSSVNFGFQFAPGAYKVVAVNATTGCTNLMASGVTIVVNPLPTVYTVTGGGGYCTGGAGVNVGLSGSNTGISYQLMMGMMPVGLPVMGSGSAISFGIQSAPGAYTVVATNVATTCTNNMSGTANVAINTLPTAFTVMGGGNYCAGGAGVHVTLTGSAIGVNYQLYRSGTIAVGSPVTGTGASIDFGAQTTAGNYTVMATNVTTTCNNWMTGSVTVGINPAPTAYSVIGGGSYCPGGIGVHIGLGNTAMGVKYQLMRGTNPVGAQIAGSGVAIDFGLQTVAGTYTVVGTDNITSCTNNMSGSAAVVINALPTAFNVIGGGNYCAGGAGLHVGLDNSTVGVNYTLFVGTATVATMSGTGSPIDFGLQTAAGTYTILAVNATTTCQSNMTGSVTIGINPVLTPSVSISSSAGTTVCASNFVTFTATAVNGGAPTFQWMVNGAAAAVGSSYSYVPSNSDVVSVMLTSSATCATPLTVSSSLTMTVDPNQMPIVAVSTDPGAAVCQGTPVTFTAIPTYGGSGATYTWVVNGANVGTASTYAYVPADGDVVYCSMVSNYHCRLANTATSSHINMQVDVPVLPIVTITANPGLNVSAGQPVSFNATVANGGSSPSYQWLVNGVSITGANMPTFVTSNLSNNDSVTCHVQSSSACAGLEGFNSVRIHVHGVGVQQVATTGSDIRLVPNPSKGIFTIKGSLGTADEDVTIEVTNMLGQSIYNTTATARNGELNERIELGSNLTNGMYILNLRTGTDNKVFHIVIEQ